MKQWLYKNVRPLRPLFNLKHLYFAWKGAKTFGHPSEELFVIGITGTSGKSSTIDFLRQLLEAAGHTVGSLSTVDFYVAGEKRMNDKKMTMLGRMKIQEYLREMVNKGCDVAIVEITSEGRVQHRNKFINVDVMAITNFYPEHIESHGSFEKYRQAKMDIFSYVGKGKRKSLSGAFSEAAKQKTAVLNADMDDLAFFQDKGLDKELLFGTKKEANLQASHISMDKDGVHFTALGETINAQVYGEYNVMNILCALAIAKASGVDEKKLAHAAQALKPVAGRIEFIDEASKIGVEAIVDYAFEPVAIAELYKVVNLREPKRIIHVFGSTGGGRDVERRFTVGEFVGKHADICIVTDEDPYDDDPEEIMADVASACQKAGKKEGEDLFVILDRQQALDKAIALAEPGDMILATGKGSEQAMVVKGKLIPWDDREALRKAITSRLSR